MNIKNNHPLEVWIGLAKVESNTEDLLSNANNAYVNVLGLSHSKSDFKKKVNLAVQKMGLQLVRFEDIEPFSKRIAHYEVDESLKRIAKDVFSNNTDIQFGTFHSYN